MERIQEHRHRALIAGPRSVLRGFDSLYRLGGEEFLIVLPRTTIEQGSEVAERVRAAVELARPGGLDVTVSLGVAACIGSDGDYGMVVARADRALYAAKRRGRNRVVASDVGGVREALGDGGLLVRPEDPAALAAALRAWLTDAELRARLRAAARERRQSLPRWEATASVVAGVLR